MLPQFSTNDPVENNATSTTTAPQNALLLSQQRWKCTKPCDWPFDAEILNANLAAATPASTCYLGHPQKTGALKMRHGDACRIECAAGHRRVLPNLPKYFGCEQGVLSALFLNTQEQWRRDWDFASPHYRCEKVAGAAAVSAGLSVQALLPEECSSSGDFNLTSSVAACRAIHRAFEFAVCKAVSEIFSQTVLGGEGILHCSGERKNFASTLVVVLVAGVERRTRALNGGGVERRRTSARRTRALNGGGVEGVLLSGRRETVVLQLAWEIEIVQLEKDLPSSGGVNGNAEQRARALIASLEGTSSSFVATVRSHLVTEIAAMELPVGGFGDSADSGTVALLVLPDHAGVGAGAVFKLVVPADVVGEDGARTSAGAGEATGRSSCTGEITDENSVEEVYSWGKRNPAVAGALLVGVLFVGMAVGFVLLWYKNRRLSQGERGGSGTISSGGQRGVEMGVLPAERRPAPQTKSILKAAAHEGAGLPTVGEEEVVPMGKKELADWVPSVKHGDVRFKQPQGLTPPPPVGLYLHTLNPVLREDEEKRKATAAATPSADKARVERADRLAQAEKKLLERKKGASSSPGGKEGAGPRPGSADSAPAKFERHVAPAGEEFGGPVSKGGRVRGGRGPPLSLMKSPETTTTDWY